MSSSEVAVRARGVSKSYRILHEQRATTFGESLMQKLRRPLSRTTAETFWALKDIDFEVQKGDVVGIIGRNGAGKSTLLKILSRITAPTTGEITIRGRVGSLLEVGTGFHPELTGAENVYLNGAILGMKRREIEQKFDEIVDFAGVEQFLDTPVKRYSSGMYVRLAFSVAAHLDPEVMIVDEVLAVGDAEFQAKCLGKMQDVARSGRTVFFVSHNMHSVAALCRTSIVLQRGSMSFIGSVPDAIAHYERIRSEKSETQEDLARRKGSGEYRVISAMPASGVFSVVEDKALRFKVEQFKPTQDDTYVIGLLFDETRKVVGHFQSTFVGELIRSEKTREYEIVFKNLWLKPGNYELNLYLKSGDNVMDYAEPACSFEISETLPYQDTDVNVSGIHSDVLTNFEFYPL